MKEPLMEMIRANADLFSWTPADMPGIDPQLVSHHLAVKAGTKPVAQRRRKMSQERAEEVARQTASLLEAGFIREMDYSTWLSNVVLVKKQNGRWRMCVDYSDLNKACPKDCYPLPNIDALVDAAAGYRLMNKIFSELIGKTVEVYVDDILAKTARPDDPLSDLDGVFSSLRQHGMRLNPLKCAFAMEAGKFLGFMITQRGVEANPEKCQAVIQMKSPGCIKDVQRLAGRLTALSRFLGASAARALPFFNLMRKGMTFEWTPACEEAFNHFKEILVAPPVLGKPRAGEPLYLYLSVTEEALAAVLVREEGKTQQPVYFVSRVLQGPELRYSKLEKLALGLLISSRRLRQYFQSHRIVVRTDQAIRQVLQKPDLAGRMMTWAIELSQYDLQYEPRHAIKAQAMADFLVEVTGDPPEETGTRWRLHVDGASNQMSGGAGVILESPAGVIYEQSTRFEFPVSNNQAEYEALLGGLILAREVGATKVEVCSDSQVVTSQVNGSYQARDPLLQRYLEKVKEITSQFQEVTVQHVPRERNTRADLLSKLASTKPGSGNRSLIQGLVKEPTIALHLMKSSPSWLDPITNFLELGKLPEDEKAAKVITRFGIPEVVISDNGTQFTDKKFMEFLSGLGIKQRFSSVEHPQTNGQVEAANKVILLGLKKCLDNKKGTWADELASVLCDTRRNRRTEPPTTTRGHERSGRKDLVEETREMAHLSETALKQRIALRYNAKVLKRDFEERDLVLRRNDVGVPTPGEGKLAVNWEGPYRVREVLSKGAYKLERLDGKEVPRTWNASSLRRFYS
ncbi:uncharacterized protein LOC107640401 [Arachis ipaensis]|uniref:uncharacterized protein LOC107640401 n=1 Tax=Arachis ipaensis TaxID=130454 RepID=UPI0007AEFA25|nr:uncharacterized protein LOC107640401 [Arachis ipaensis]